MTTADNDVAGFTVSETAASVNESGTEDTFTVVLNTRPSSDVRIGITSKDTGEAAVSPGSLTFTYGNWDKAQTVTVTGVDDAWADGEQTTAVILAVSDTSGDDAYDSVADRIVTVTVTETANVAPEITGQDTLTTLEETALEITLSHLTVTDPDSTFPNDFTLTVQDGENYTRTGSAVTPADDFSGTLTVPVTVNDGTDDSDIFSLSVTVFAKKDIVFGGTAAFSVKADADRDSTVSAGDTLICMVNIPNTGSDDAEDVVFTLPIPGNTVYGAGTLTHMVTVSDAGTLLASGNTVRDTDSGTAYYDGDQIEWQGDIPAGSGLRMFFDITVDDDAQAGDTVTAQGNLFYDLNGDGKNEAEALIDGNSVTGDNPATTPILDASDTDSDGIPDWWEDQHGMNPDYPDDAAADSDEDGLNALCEFLAGTEPDLADSDYDGVTDREETDAGTGFADMSDADSDGIPDWWEIRHGLEPYDPGDADRDADRDSLSNLDEFSVGTDPNSADTDGDSFSDRDEVDTGSDPADRLSGPAGSYHDADFMLRDHEIGLSELLRMIQIYSGTDYHCDAAGKDGYGLGEYGAQSSCIRHSADYKPRDWKINLNELLRVIQFYNVGAYHPDADGEDGFAPGPG